MKFIFVNDNLLSMKTITKLCLFGEISSRNIQKIPYYFTLNVEAVTNDLAWI